MQILIICICAGLVSQFIKVITSLLRNKRLHLRAFITTGGMPSTHAAVAGALAASVALVEGMDSTAFAVSAVLAFVVFCDAAYLRRSPGKQPDIFSLFVSQLKKQKPAAGTGHNLDEIAGHTVLQVISGALLGAAVSCLWFMLLG